MEIEIKKAEMKSHYELTVDKLYEITLNREDIKEVMNLERGSPVASPIAEDGTQILLYPHPDTIEDHFSSVPAYYFSCASQVYYNYIGLDVSTMEEFAKEIQAKGKMPILLDPLNPNISKRGCLGYVLMKCTV